MMRTIEMGRTGVHVPVIGQGTWQMGIDSGARKQEIEALRTGIEAGLTLIDTAEMYAQGGSERVVGEAIRDVRDRVYIVTKVWPTNGTYEGTLKSADASSSRLGTTIDLYLLHWPSASIPVAETMRAMRKLVQDGVIKAVGVSNFTVELMNQAEEALGDVPLTANQLPLHLRRRAIEREVLPHCVDRRVTVMAYSPLGQGNFPEPGTAQRELLDEIGAKYGATAHQVAINWVASHDGVMTIPKASKVEHVLANARALDFTLSSEDLARLDAVFPAGDAPYETSYH